MILENKFSRKGLIISVLFFFSGLTHAQNFSEKHIKPALKRATDSSSVTILAFGGAATLAATSQDHAMKDQWDHHQKMSKEDASKGDFLGTGIPGVAIALGQLYWDPENGEAHSRALSFTAINTYLIKYSVGRNRPNSNDRLSFPSGHTSTSFATATSLTYAYGWKAAVIAYPLALGSGLSRLADNAHWFSDVVGGATLGILWGRATYYNQDKPQTVIVLPMVLPESSGILIVSHF